MIVREREVLHRDEGKKNIFLAMMEMDGCRKWDLQRNRKCLSLAIHNQLISLLNSIWQLKPKGEERR